MQFWLIKPKIFLNNVNNIWKYFLHDHRIFHLVDRLFRLMQNARHFSAEYWILRVYSIHVSLHASPPCKIKSYLSVHHRTCTNCTRPSMTTWSRRTRGADQACRYPSASRGTRWGCAYMATTAPIWRSHRSKSTPSWRAVRSFRTSSLAWTWVLPIGLMT